MQPLTIDHVRDDRRPRDGRPALPGSNPPCDYSNNMII